MFQSSRHRLRALLTLADDLLGANLVGSDLAAGDLVAGDPAPATPPHPHRRPVRIDRERRVGSVSPRAMHCLSPVRPTASDGVRRDRVS